MESIENSYVDFRYVESTFMPSFMQAYNTPFLYLICQIDLVTFELINHIPVFTSNQKNMLAIGQSKYYFHKTSNSDDQKFHILGDRSNIHVSVH